MLAQARQMNTADDLARARARLIYWDGVKETREMAGGALKHVAFRRRRRGSAPLAGRTANSL